MHIRLQTSLSNKGTLKESTTVRLIISESGENEQHRIVVLFSNCLAPAALEGRHTAPACLFVSSRFNKLTEDILHNELGL